MLIRCPECAYTRQINEDKIPAGSEFATCPKCNCRFRFRSLAPDLIPAEQADQPDSVNPEHQVGRTAPGNHTDLTDRTDLAGRAGGGQVKQENPAGKTDRTDPDVDAHMDVWSAVEDLNARWERGRKEDENAVDADEAIPAKPHRDDQSGPEPTDGVSDDQLEDENFKARDADAFESGAPDKAGGSNSRDMRSETKQPGFLANSGSVPWEYKGGFLHPLGLLRTILFSFSKVPEFFGGIPAHGSLAPALVFVLLMRGLQFCITFAVIKWEVVTEQGEHLSLTMAELTKVSASQLFITTLFIVIFLQFASALLVNFMVRLVEPGRPRFNVTFKVLAYSLSPLIFILLPQVGILLAEIGSLLLLTLGLRHAYRLNWGKTLTVMLPLILLMVLLNMNSLRLLS